jgi:hypothetical protein
MITTARRCRGRLAPLLALLTTTAATPVDYAADHVVFAHVRTGEGNRALQFYNQFQGHFFFSAFRRVSEAQRASKALKQVK